MVLQQKNVKAYALWHYSYKTTLLEIVEQDWYRAGGDRDWLSVDFFFLSSMVNVN